MTAQKNVKRHIRGRLLMVICCWCVLGARSEGAEGHTPVSDAMTMKHLFIDDRYLDRLDGVRVGGRMYTMASADGFDWRVLDSKGFSSGDEYRLCYDPLQKRFVCTRKGEVRFDGTRPWIGRTHQNETAQ